MESKEFENKTAYEIKAEVPWAWAETPLHATWIITFRRKTSGMLYFYRSGNFQLKDMGNWELADRFESREQAESALRQAFGDGELIESK